eukprot:g3856.t1
MCGIALVVGPTESNESSDLSNDLHSYLKSRGPDSSKRWTLDIEEKRNLPGIGNESPSTGSKTSHKRQRTENPTFNCRISFYAAVLRLRGDDNTEDAKPDSVDSKTYDWRQPILMKSGNVLLWNGEMFAGKLLQDATRKRKTQSKDSALSQSLSDTCILADALERELASLPQNSSSALHTTILSILEKIHGPFSFIFFHRPTNEIFFAKDKLGRRSLCYTDTHFTDKKNQNQNHKGFCLTSVVPPSWNTSKNSWKEIEPFGLYHCKLSSSFESCFHLLPWKTSHPYDGLATRDLMSKATTEEFLRIRKQATTNLYRLLLDSVRRRLVDSDDISSTSNFVKHVSANRPRARRVGVLFSGGLDSLLLAGLLHKVLEENEEGGDGETVRIGCSGELSLDGKKKKKNRVPILLYNVCFDAPNHRSPDRLASVIAVEALRRRFPQRTFHLIMINRDLLDAGMRHEENDRIKTSCSMSSRVAALCFPQNTIMDHNIGSALWSVSHGTNANEGIVCRMCEKVILNQCLGQDKADGGIDMVTDTKKGSIQGQSPSSSQFATEGILLRRKEQEHLARCRRGEYDHYNGDIELLLEEMRVKLKELQTRAKGRKHHDVSRNVKKKALEKERLENETSQNKKVKLTNPTEPLSRTETKTTQEEQHEVIPTNSLLRQTTMDSVDTCCSNKGCNRKRKAKCYYSLCAKCCRLVQKFTVIGKNQPCRVHPLGKKKQKNKEKEKEKGKGKARERTKILQATGVSGNDNVRSSYPMKTFCCPHNPPPLDVSPPSILFSGVGADEQCAGYGRHSTAFRQGGLKRLRSELEKDCRRLWLRNHGRDDRCISDSGKEVRYPFLDEDVVQYLASLPLDVIVQPYEEDFQTLSSGRKNEKEDCKSKEQLLAQSGPPPLKLKPAFTRGKGDKFILRQVLQSEECLGITWGNVGEFQKRAIQFGTRIAQHYNKKVFGSHSKGKGSMTINH